MSPVTDSSTPAERRAMGVLPPGWQWAFPGDIGDYLNGRGFRRAEWSDTGRPIVRIQNLTGSGTGFNHFEGVADDRHVVRDGDLLVSWGATVGVHIWRGPDGVLNRNIFKVESYIDAAFHRYLLSSVFDDAQRHNRGSATASISKSGFDSTAIPVPPLAEQRRIATAIDIALSHLDTAVAQLRSAEHRTARLATSPRLGVLAEERRVLELAHRLTNSISSGRRRAAALRRAIFAAAFAGQLVPQDPNDEPASELLGRVRAERPTSPTTKRRKATAS